MVYDLTLIEEWHWNELLKVFNLEMTNDLNRNKKTLRMFLFSSLNTEESTLIATALGTYILGLTNAFHSHDTKIFKEIALCNDDHTTITWFADNMDKFVN